MAVQWLVNKWARASGEIPMAFCITTSPARMCVSSIFPFPPSPPLPFPSVFVRIRSVFVRLARTFDLSVRFAHRAVVHRRLRRPASSFRVKPKRIARHVRRRARMCVTRSSRDSWPGAFKACQPRNPFSSLARSLGGGGTTASI